MPFVRNEYFILKSDCRALKTGFRANEKKFPNIFIRFSRMRDGLKEEEEE